jgi:hypothetical protein
MSDFESRLLTLVAVAVIAIAVSAFVLPLILGEIVDELRAIRHHLTSDIPHLPRWTVRKR